MIGSSSEGPIFVWRDTMLLGTTSLRMSFAYCVFPSKLSLNKRQEIHTLIMEGMVIMTVRQEM